MPFLQNHRRLRVALFVTAGLVGTLVAVLLVVGFLVDLGGIVGGQLEAIRPKVQAQVGRDIHFGRASLRLLPSARLELHDVVLDGQAGQTGVLGQPLLQVGTVRAKVAVGPLLWSLGRKVEVTSLEIADLRIQVARTADGHLSYQDILDKLATQPESPPMTQAEIDRLGDIVVQKGALTDAGIFFYDLSSPYGAATPLRLHSIQFAVKDAQLFAPFSLSLDMAVLAATSNFHLALGVGPLPRDLQLGHPLGLLRSADLDIQPIEIEPLLRFLPPSPGVNLGRAKVSAKLKLETPADGGQLQLNASAGAQGLVLEDATASRLVGGRQGKPTDIRLDAALAMAPLAGDVKIDRMNLTVNDMEVSGQADLRSLWTTPAVNKLSLTSRGLFLEKLLAVMPATALPKGADLRGPLVVRGAASGSPTSAQVEVALDLTPATIILPELNKPAGTALSLELRGKVESGAAGTGADIDRLGFTLGPLALFLHGKIRSADDLDLKLDSGSVDLDKLLRLLPTVEKSVPKGSRIDGDLRISGTLKKQKDTLDAGAQVNMANARVDEGDFSLRGSSALSAQVHSTPQAATVKADLDLSGTQLRVPGSVEKGSGVPMRLRANIERSGQVVKVQLAELTLPGGTVRLVGQIDSAHNQLDLKVPPVDLDLARLSQVLPSLRKGTAGGLLDSKLRIGVSFTGNPNRLGTARAALDEFAMTVAGGNVKGSAEVIGLDEPRRVTFNFSGDRLDLDRILGSDEGSKSEDDTPSQGPPNIPGFVRRLDMNGRVAIDSGKYKGAAVRDLLFEITMASGKLVIKTLRGQAFGGSVNASGSTIDFGPSRPRFSLKAKLDKIDVGDVMAMRGGDTARRFSGHGSMDLSADGQGLAWADIAPRVTGLMAMGLTDGKLQSAGIGGNVLVPLLNRLGKGFAGSTDRDMHLRDLNAQFRIENGRLNTVNPVRFGTEDSTMTLTGSVGLDKTLALTGNFDLSPQIVSKATGGRIAPDAPVPIAVRIGGSISDPKVEMVDIERSVMLLLGAIARGRGKELLSGRGLPVGGVGQPLQNALGGVLGGAHGGATPSGGTGAPPALPTTPPSGPAPQPADDARRRLEEAGKKGLGGLFGR